MCSSKKYPSPPRRGGLHPSGHPPRISIPGGACHTPPPPVPTPWNDYFRQKCQLSLR